VQTQSGNKKISYGYFEDIDEFNFMQQDNVRRNTAKVTKTTPSSENKTTLN